MSRSQHARGYKLVHNYDRSNVRDRVLMLRSIEERDQRRLDRIAWGDRSDATWIERLDNERSDPREQRFKLDCEYAEQMSDYYRDERFIEDDEWKARYDEQYWQDMGLYERERSEDWFHHEYGARERFYLDDGPCIDRPTDVVTQGITFGTLMQQLQNRPVDVVY